MIEHPCILNDVTHCIGCGECVAACKEINRLPAEDPPPRAGRSTSGLTATRWTSVVRRPEGVNVRVHCRHCREPACVALCPVGALQRTPEGPVVSDGSMCIGCRTCIMSCPYGIPRYEWSSLNPSVRQCVLCYEKLASGEIDRPACVRDCPEEATAFGSRDEMLAEARRRLATEPDRYIDQIWGEHEMGGTSVLYVSHVDLSFLSRQGPGRHAPGAPPDPAGGALPRMPSEMM